MEQDRLSAEILRRLAESGLGRYGLKVRCCGGSVTLQGIVDVLADKLAAERTARETPGVGGIENDIVVCTDGTVDDHDVALEVAEELTGAFGTAEIGAEVAGGRVVLLGQVATAADAAKAVAAASKARGVREIVSGLRLADQVKQDGPSLVNAIEAALAGELGITARRLCVTVQEGSVSLTGEVPRHELAKRAVAIASRVPGVRQVDNRITIAPVPHEALIAALMERIGSDPKLNKAPLSFVVQEGRLVARGSLPDLEAKRALDRALRSVYHAYRIHLRGIDNIVRIVR